MRAFLGTSPYDTTISQCCGVREIGSFLTNDGVASWQNEYEYPKIKDIESFGCDIFISTFLPSQSNAMRECEKYHTLLFKTGPHKNKGPDASLEGKTLGVYLCVFKYGKETAK